MGPATIDTYFPPLAHRSGRQPPAIALPPVKALYRRFQEWDTSSFVGRATTGSLVRSAAIALLRGMLGGMLFGFMRADHAAGSSPEGAMVAGMMPGDPADCRTFQTAGGGRWGRARRGRSYCLGYCRRDQDCSHSRHLSKVSRRCVQRFFKYPRSPSVYRSCYIPQHRNVIE